MQIYFAGFNKNNEQCTDMAAVVRMCTERGKTDRAASADIKTIGGLLSVTVRLSPLSSV